MENKNDNVTNKNKDNALHDVEEEIERIRAKLNSMSRDEFRAALTRLYALEAQALQWRSQ